MSKWKQLGTLLGLGDGGELLDEGSEEDYPPTWEGLYTVVEDTELTEVAVKLKEAVTTARVLMHRDTHSDEHFSNQLQSF